MSVSFAPKENPTLGLMSKMHFGMFKGTSVNKVILKNPFYMIWAMETIDWLDLKDEVVNSINSAQITENFVFSFGKYDKRSVTWVLRNDMNYFEWFINGMCASYEVKVKESLMDLYYAEVRRLKEENNYTSNTDPDCYEEDSMDELFY
jgi:hypothetical protein